MKKYTRWHYWVVAIGIAIGLLIAFWPRPLTDPTTEGSNDEISNQNAAPSDDGDTADEQRDD